MAFAVLKDAVRTTVSSYTVGSGSMILTSITGFPTPTPSAPILVTAIVASTYATFPETYATYQCTGISGQTLTGLTLVSGVDTAFVAGDIVEMRTNAKHVNDLETALSASIVTAATEATLPGSRKLAAGANITITDNGAGSTLVVASTASGGTGTVTSVSVATANGVSGTVATATTTPAITLALGAITPTSVAATGTVGGSNLSGTNTGDQTNVSGTAGTITGSIAESQVTNLTSDLATLSAGIAAAGTVKSVSVATANGFAGTVATATTTPVITLSTGVTGLLKGNGTGVTAAIAGTDYVATTTITEISETASFTATANSFYAISGSANLTATLPTAVGITGQTIRIRCTNSYTGLCTITGTGGQTINGAASRIIFAGESPLLQSDGSNWVRTGGTIIPTVCQLSQSVDQTIPNNAETLVALDTLAVDNTGQMANITTHQIKILRPGTYRVSGGGAYAIDTSQNYSIFNIISKNGSNTTAFGQQLVTTGFTPPGSNAINVSSLLLLAAGDLLTLNTFQANTGSNSAAFKHVFAFLDANENLSW